MNTSPDPTAQDRLPLGDGRKKLALGVNFAAYATPFGVPHFGDQEITLKLERFDRLSSVR